MASSIGYAGFQCPPDDEIDLSSYEERLLASESWRRVTLDEQPDLPLEASAHADCVWVIDRFRGPPDEVHGALDDFCRAHEVDDRKAAHAAKAAA